jgi:small multidrug resistance family-3 protein
MVESLVPLDDTNIIIVTLVLFFVAALMEIGGGLIGGLILFFYGIIPTLQPSHFGRTYAAYGGIFIISSVVWGIIVDKKRPDRCEIIGSLVAIGGAIIIFYTPR